MTRPDKHAARFGARYLPPIDYRRLLKAVRESLPIIRSITAAMRRVGEGLRNHTLTVVPSRSQPGRLAIVPTAERWTFAPHIANLAAPTLAELEAATPIRVSLLTGESLDGQILGPPYDTRYTRSSGPITWTTSPTVTWGGPTASGDILDRIDDTLNSYDSQRATGEQPWPYRGF